MRYKNHPFLYCFISCRKKALLVQFGRTWVSKTQCRRFKSYRAWFCSCYVESKKRNLTKWNCNLHFSSWNKKYVSDAQRKYFVANEQDIEELSICKIIIMDTVPQKKGIFCYNRTRSDLDHSRIEVDLLYKKKISMNFYEMVSRDSANCLDHGISLRNRNPCYQRISCDYF